MALDGARLGTHALQLVYEATNNVKLPNYDKLEAKTDKPEEEMKKEIKIPKDEPPSNKVESITKIFYTNVAKPNSGKEI
jgi:hypothetical protein